MTEVTEHTYIYKPREDKFLKTQDTEQRWQTGWPDAEPQREQCYGIPAERPSSTKEKHHQITYSQKGKKKYKTEE